MKLSPGARDLFRRLGRIGGKTRAKKLSADERSEIARRAANIRHHGADGILTKDDITFVGWTTQCPCGYTVTFSSKTDNEKDVIALWNAHCVQCPCFFGYPPRRAK